MLTKQGVTGTEAIHLIEKTHYAYSVKSEVEQTLELVIPFYTICQPKSKLLDGNGRAAPAHLRLSEGHSVPNVGSYQYDEEELSENNACRTASCQVMSRSGMTTS
jgi:hypothetical protein